MINYAKYYQGAFWYNLRKFIKSLKVRLYFIWLYIKVDLTCDRKWLITPFKNKIELLEHYSTLEFLKGNEIAYEQIIKGMTKENIKTLEDVESFIGFEDFGSFYDMLLYKERVSAYLSANK